MSSGRLQGYNLPGEGLGEGGKEGGSCLIQGMFAEHPQHIPLFQYIHISIPAITFESFPSTSHKKNPTKPKNPKKPQNKARAGLFQRQHPNCILRDDL